MRATTNGRMYGLVIPRALSRLTAAVTASSRVSSVVARINYLRFVKPGPTPLEFDATLEKLTRAAERFNAEKIKESDIQRVGGPAEPEGD